MQIGSVEVPGNLALAPMAGVTDLAFRTICAQLGADLTVTEMVSAKALVYGDRKTAALMKPNPGSVVAVQIFGSEPEVMARGAQLALEQSGCQIIDINMGCPVPKIVNNGEGSALMKHLPLAAEIIRAVAAAVPVPVTVKMRLGWDRGSINAVELAQLAEENGAAAIAVHGRTRTQQYGGRADWDEIAKVKRAVTIPVLANGDVVSGEDAVRCLRRTGCDGVMIGRMAFGNPWIFAQAKAALEGRPIPVLPPLAERIDTAVRQIHMAAEDKGERVACLEARKQLAWYLKGVAHAAYYKEQISHLDTLEQMETIAKGIKRDVR